jgi:hypothetical protein
MIMGLVPLRRANPMIMSGLSGARGQGTSGARAAPA